jgi:biopolymer transport protein ExbD
MRFYPRRRRQAPTIIIISLIDVLIVMLVFMLVTTTYRNQPAIKLNLPETTEAPRPGATQEAPPLVVTIAKDEPYFYLGANALGGDQLLGELRAAATKDPQLKLVLRADADASWRHVVKVMDFARQLKITNVKAFMKGTEGATGNRGALR